MGFLSVFKKVGSGLKKVWGLAESAGLSKELLQLALHWVKVAESKYVDNAQRREWVVSILKDKGVPEGIARIAVELALKALKSGVDKLG